MPQAASPSARPSNSPTVSLVQKDLQGEILSKSFAPEPTPDDLALINTYTRRPLAADGVYVAEAYIANDQVDRDGERFHPELLEKYAQTLPGKKLNLDHVKQGLGYGRFYSARTLTEDGVKWLAGRFYVPRRDRTQSLIEALEDGLADTVSIHGRAKRVVTKKSAGDNGGVIAEYQDAAGAEAWEVSLVWQGSQYGAVVKEPTIEPATKEPPMTLKVLGKEYDPDEAQDAITTIEKELVDLREIKKALEVESIDEARTRNAEALIGRELKKSLEAEALRMGVLAKVVGDSADERERFQKLFASYDVPMLKTEIDRMTRMVPKGDILDATASGDKPAEEKKKPERLVPASAYVV